MPQIEIPPHLRVMCCENIAALDGGMFGAQVNAHVGAVLRDILNRRATLNGNPEHRKIKIELDFVGKVELNKATNTVEVVEIIVTPSADLVMPKTRGDANVLRMKSGHLLFNAEFPKDFEQPPLPLDGRECDPDE